MDHEKVARLLFSRVLVIFSLALVCILRRVFEQLVTSRAVTMLRYTRCNIVILIAATAWLIGAATKITMLNRAYLNMIRRAQLCIDAGGNHLQHLV